MSAVVNSKIIGIGCDICGIGRIRRSVTHLGDDWINHVFTPMERDLAFSAPDPVVWFARGFCSKEAWVKASGIGQANGVGWKEIEILQDLQSPRILVGPRAEAKMAEVLPPNTQAVFRLTTAVDSEFAYAFVVAISSLIDSFSRK